jgi:Flp pilus assembly protein TadG
MRFIRRIDQLGKETGQAIVEFAVVVPALFILITAIVQFGSTYQHYETITDAARAGARKAAVSRTSASPVADAKAAAVASSGGLITASNVTVTPAPPWNPGTTQVTVTVTYPYSISLTGIPVKSGNLTSATTERVE